MKVLLRRNIANLGQIGDVVDVKPGYARNYLVPYGHATQPTAANLKAVEAEKAAYLAQLAEEKAALEARAAQIDGKEVTLAARANEEGHLYGSVGPAQIVEALVAEGHTLEPHHVALDVPIRQLDKYDVTIRFEHDVTAQIHVWVVPVHEPAAVTDGEGDSTGAEAAAAGEPATGELNEAAEPTDADATAEPSDEPIETDEV
ncbi:MAG: 50S ribosomal protein L9 [Phycisphaerae bacterium]|nr:50S ribosomal protein L9 [Phycisphaerae bacterium]